MAAPEISQEEAERLICMLKDALVQAFEFPLMGNKREFEVEGIDSKDLFIISIYRGNINSLKYNISARIKLNNILLMELHINDTGVHLNPDGSKIKGSHWHIYSEKYGRKEAFPAEDFRSDDFVENTIAFLNKFNVINKPKIVYQGQIDFS